MEYQKWLKQISKEVWDNDIEKNILKHLKHNEYAEEEDLKAIHKYIVDLHFAYMHSDYGVLLDTFKDTNWLEILKSEFKIYETESLINLIHKDLKSKGFYSEWLKYLNSVKMYKDKHSFMMIEFNEIAKQEMITPFADTLELLIHFLAIKPEVMNDLFFKQFKKVENEKENLEGFEEQETLV